MVAIHDSEPVYSSNLERYLKFCYVKSLLSLYIINEIYSLKRQITLNIIFIRISILLIRGKDFYGNGYTFRVSYYGRSADS